MARSRSVVAPTIELILKYRLKTPTWYNRYTGLERFSSIAELQGLLPEAEQVDRENDALVLEAKSKAIAFLSDAEKLLGKNSSQYQAVCKVVLGLNLTAEKFSNLVRYRISTLEAKAKTDNAALEAKRKDEQKIALAVRATAWLAARNQLPGRDFEAARAVDVANERAYEEEVERLTSGASMHSFGGDDSCEGCSGWDGTSRRCACGNRRVSWTRGYSHTFESPEVYAEAY